MQQRYSFFYMIHIMLCFDVLFARNKPTIPHLVYPYVWWSTTTFSCCESLPNQGIPATGKSWWSMAVAPTSPIFSDRLAACIRDSVFQVIASDSHVFSPYFHLFMQSGHILHVSCLRLVFWWYFLNLLPFLLCEESPHSEPKYH